MAIFSVNNTNDSGAGSLRQAILSANALTGKDLINFDGVFADTIADTITLGNSLNITDDLSINGTGAEKLTVSGNNNSRVFEINFGVSVDIAGLAVANGYDSTGGAGIQNFGTLTVTNSKITGNSTDGNGGGIFNSGTLTVNNSQISNNLTSDSRTSGGGIYNNGSMLISNSTINNNSSVNNGGGIYNNGSVIISFSTISSNSVGSSPNSFGGGIYNQRDIIINNTTISNNSAGSGGGIASKGASFGGIIPSTITIRNSTISANSASSDGGGIYNAGSAVGVRNSSAIIVSNTTFDSNSATFTGAGIYNNGSLNTGTLTVGSSTFNKNSARFGGAGIYNGGTATVSNSNFNNSVSSDGAGIYNEDDGVLSVNFTNFSSNSSESLGGGIYNQGTATVNNTTFENNKVISGGGGGLYNIGSIVLVSSTLSSNSSPAFGGGIYNQGTATVNNTTITGNLSQFKGGGIYNDAILTIANSTIILNTAYNNENLNPGGGVYNADQGTATIKNSIIAGNFDNPNNNSTNTTAPDVVGSFISNGFNLIGNLNGSKGFKKSEQLNVPIKEVLDTTLRDNGSIGVTKTHALVTGSRAINAGLNADIPIDTTDLDEDNNVTEQIPLDQRGSNFERISGGQVDIGAFEAQVNVINGTPKPDTLEGTDTDDIITGFKGRDILTGGLGADAFTYTSILDADDTITDFEPTIDKIVLRPAFERLGLSSLNYKNAIAGGYLQFAPQGSNTAVLIDPDGTTGKGRAARLVTVDKVSTSALNKSVNFAF